MVDRFESPSVDVNGIAQGLKGEKRDPDRQKNIEWVVCQAGQGAENP